LNVAYNLAFAGLHVCEYGAFPADGRSAREGLDDILVQRSYRICGRASVTRPHYARSSSLKISAHRANDHPVTTEIR
jgi:hypothetical protein